MTQYNGSLMIKPAVKNENAADLLLQIETDVRRLRRYDSQPMRD
jgi:hypothetical protein